MKRRLRVLIRRECKKQECCIAEITYSRKWGSAISHHMMNDGRSVDNKDRAKSANSAHWSIACVLCFGSVNAAVSAAVNEASNMLRARDDEGPGILKPMLVGFALRFPIWASPESALYFLGDADF